MTPRCEAGWVVLQSISCAHALWFYMNDWDYRAKGGRVKKTKLLTGSELIGLNIGRPPLVIRENVEILGRGDEEEIKNRIAYYHMYYPDICETARLDRIKKQQQEA